MSPKVQKLLLISLFIDAIILIVVIYWFFVR